MQTKLIFAIAILFAVVIAGGMLIAWPAQVHAPTATTIPANSAMPFTYDDKVTVTSPLPNATVSRAFTVNGKARGMWYFEASFPVQVRDKDNNKIAQAIAQAQSDWMTEEFVPFVATVSVSGYSGAATLVLLKDNPSGLPENDDAVEIPVVIE